MSGHFVSEVHRSESGLLYVQKPLVQQDFGVSRRKGQGRCLISQVAFSIAAVLPGIRPSRIVTHIDKHVPRKICEDGHTIAEILETFKHPIKTDHSWHAKLDVEITKHSAYDTVLVDVMNGQPVMFMVDRDVCAVLLSEALSYQDGEVRATVIRHGRTGKYHALLAIGVDLEGYVIMRDSRSTYAFKGYAKIATHILQDGWRYLDAMSLLVRGVDKVYLD